MEIFAVLTFGFLFAVATSYAVATRSGLHAALAGHGTAVGLSDPAAETVACDTRGLNRTDWQLTAVDNLTAAEDLLDCLEAHGHADRELVVLGNSSFAVRWR